MEGNLPDSAGNRRGDSMTTERIAELRGYGLPAHWGSTTSEEMAEILDLAEVTIRAREFAATRAKNLRIRRKRPGVVQPAATLPRVTAPRRKTPTLGPSLPLLEPQFRDKKKRRL